VELAGALVPLAALAAAWWRGRELVRRAGWELGLAGLGLAVAMAPGVGNFRWSFRWLPLFFVALGLAGGHALALLARPGGRGAAPWAAVAVLAVWLAALARGPLGAHVLVQGGFLLACCLVWVCAEGRLVPALARWAPGAVLLLTLLVHYANPRSLLEVFTWPIPGDGRPANALDPQRRYLSVYAHQDLFSRDGRGQGVDLYPGSSVLYSGARLVNGYSPLRPDGLTAVLGFRIHGSIDAEDAYRLLGRETGPGGLLELLGVDGLVLSSCYEHYAGWLGARGWEEVAAPAGCRVLHRRRPTPPVRAVGPAAWCDDVDGAFDALTGRRRGPLPLFLDAGRRPGPALAGGKADVQLVRQSRTVTEAEVRAAEPGQEVLVAFAQAWHPGYRARLDGKAVPVYRLNFLVPAVLLPAGAEGRLVLEYCPPSFVLGRTLALATAALCALLLATGWPRRRADGRVPAGARAGWLAPLVCHPETEQRGVAS
jgi:hypothetical protein